jgi:hypothetical protein
VVSPKFLPFDLWKERLFPLVSGVGGHLSGCKRCGIKKAPEEFRHLGYKNPVCTSQETHYVSATEHSRLKLCKI